MSDQEDVNELRAKLQEQAAEFESYKEECKHIEQMLEEDCQKKEEQIKQLKQQAIKRQKGEKMLKAQVSQLQAEVANLKTQLGDVSSNSSANSKQELQKLLNQNKTLKQNLSRSQCKVTELEKIVEGRDNQLKQQGKTVEVLKLSLAEAETKLLEVPKVQNAPSANVAQQNNQAATAKLQEQIKKLKQKLAGVEKDKAKLEKAYKEKQVQSQKMKHDFQQKLKKSQSLAKQKREEEKPSKREHSEHKQVRETVSLSEHKFQINKLKQTLNQLQQRNQALDHLHQEQKHKISTLMNQKSSLMSKVKHLQHELQKQKERVRETQSPQKNSSSEIMIQGQNQSHIHQNTLETNLRMDCLLLTKRHYISPFIEIKDGKVIKVYKSTKNGFQKSLGATKHKFDSVGYQIQKLITTSIEYAKLSISQGNSHSLVIYGSKQTKKQQIMASVIEGLKQWILEKVEEHQESGQVHSLYLRHSLDQDKNTFKEATSKEQISELIDELVSMGPQQSTSPSSKTSPLKSKKGQKSSKIRYFSIRFSQNLALEVVTTSYLNPFVKNGQTFTDYLNTIVFSKLPNILQLASTNYHIVTTINPIVNFYEDCKNTLSITMVPLRDSNSSVIQNEPMTSTLVYSPSINKDDLNDLTKKKIESFEKETQQAGLKVRRIQEQCNYYKNRFEQLEIRLKNLINTHQPQNNYLKKSPVTLSYEKLLKFVNSVLARNSNLGSSRGGFINFGNSDQSNTRDQVEMYIEEDAKSLDGY